MRDKITRFTMIPNYAYDDLALTAIDLDVLGAIARVRDADTGLSSITQATIARKRRLSRRRVQYAIKMLIKVGCLEAIARWRDDGGGRDANAYRVIYEDPEKRSAKPSAGLRERGQAPRPVLDSGQALKRANGHDTAIEANAHPGAHMVGGAYVHPGAPMVGAYVHHGAHSKAHPGAHSKAHPGAPRIKNSLREIEAADAAEAEPLRDADADAAAGAVAARDAQDGNGHDGTFTPVRAIALATRSGVAIALTVAPESEPPEASQATAAPAAPGPDAAKPEPVPAPAAPEPDPNAIADPVIAWTVRRWPKDSDREQRTAALTAAYESADPLAYLRATYGDDPNRCGYPDIDAALDALEALEADGTTPEQLAPLMRAYERCLTSAVASGAADPGRVAFDSLPRWRKEAPEARAA